MVDPRISKLAYNLVNYSCGVKRGERVLVESKGTDTSPLIQEIVAEVAKAGGIPFWYFNDELVERRWLQNASEKQQIEFGKMHLPVMKNVSCYISVRGTDNSFALADIPHQRMDWYMKHFYTPVHFKQRVRKTRWVVMRYPNDAMSQLAETSREKFEDFYYSVCNLDYSIMSKAMTPLCRLMARTDRVHIKGPGTDLEFSIKGIPPVKCDGHRNIPDGEVYTAPVKNSINGVITYNASSLDRTTSTVFDGIRFEFKNGKIVKADCTQGDPKTLNKILDTDAGARYIGEFAIGVNPNIKDPMRDTLFDEKIYGSIHLTPGQCYDEAPNGNKSSIHWDLVLIQTKEYGGGEIYFDGKLIRKNGLFVHPALKDKLSARALRGR